MAQKTDIFELERLGLRPGEGRRLDLHVHVGRLSFGGQAYDVPAELAVQLDVSRMTGAGYALRLRFEAKLDGPCMRCLEPAAPVITVDAREVSQPGGGDELTSPYVDSAGELDLSVWARDALSLAVPDQITCTPDCAGLCPECGVNLNQAGPEHHHDRAPDSRWAKLSEIRFE
jgi:DUF177 domain-containing protein